MRRISAAFVMLLAVAALIACAGTGEAETPTADLKGKSPIFWLPEPEPMPAQLWWMTETAWRPVSAAGLSADEMAKLPRFAMRRGEMVFRDGRCPLALGTEWRESREPQPLLGGSVQPAKAGYPGLGCATTDWFEDRLAQLRRYEFRDVAHDRGSRQQLPQLLFFASGGQDGPIGGQRIPDKPALVYERDPTFDEIAKYAWAFVTINGEDVTVIRGRERSTVGVDPEPLTGAVAALVIERTGDVRVWGICKRPWGLMRSTDDGAWQIRNVTIFAVACQGDVEIGKSLEAMLRSGPSLRLAQTPEGAVLTSEGPEPLTKLVGTPLMPLPVGRWKLTELTAAGDVPDPWYSIGQWRNGSFVVPGDTGIVVETTPDHIDISTNCGKQRVDFLDRRFGAVLALDSDHDPFDRCDSRLALSVVRFFQGNARGDGSFVIYVASGKTAQGPTKMSLQLRYRSEQHTLRFERLP